jgi:YD repeat-containing protein
MSNRTLSRAALLFLLTALTLPGVKVAALKGRPHSARDRGQAQAGRTNEGAQKGAIYDGAGRAVKTTVPTSETEKVTVSLKYDKRNRIQAVALDNGTRVGLVYDASGQWQGFSFADGGKMLFERNAAGEIVGFARVTRSANEKLPSAGRPGVRRVGFGAPTLDGCASATASAVAAAVVAAGACLEGPSIQCATAVASAAVAAARAYEACKDRISAAVESEA